MEWFDILFRWNSLKLSCGGTVWHSLAVERSETIFRWKGLKLSCRGTVWNSSSVEWPETLLQGNGLKLSCSGKVWNYFGGTVWKSVAVERPETQFGRTVWDYLSVERSETVLQWNGLKLFQWNGLKLFFGSFLLYIPFLYSLNFFLLSFLLFSFPSPYCSLLSFSSFFFYFFRNSSLLPFTRLHHTLLLPIYLFVLLHFSHTHFFVVSTFFFSFLINFFPSMPYTFLSSRLSLPSSFIIH